MAIVFIRIFIASTFLSIFIAAVGLGKEVLNITRHPPTISSP